MGFLAQAVIAALLCAPVLGHPKSSSTSRRTLHRRVIDLGAFRLDAIPSFSNATATEKSGLGPLVKRADYISTASALVAKVVPGAQFRLVDDYYVGANGVAHANFKQTVHGLDVDNADFNVNIAADGKIFSYGNSFFTGAVPAADPLAKVTHIDPVAALKKVSSTLVLPITAESATAVAAEKIEHYVLKGTKGAHSDPKAHLVYFQNADKTLSLAWRMETDIIDNWLQTYIDAKTGDKILGVIDYVSDVSYTVYPWEVNDPAKGARSVETNPYSTAASPFGWESNGVTTYTTTQGNNGIAQANYAGDTAYLNDYRPSSTGGNFAFTLDLKNTDPKTYSNASVTQLWYTANLYHDLLYDLGFTEAAGNFQTNNNGKGGKAADAVILNAQDGAGTDNADFATPADGSAPRMRMFIWDYSTPKRDCSFDAGVIIHEYTHGVSNRLTGGPANVACLNVLEAGGMGEGWGDFMAIAIHTKTTDTRATNYPLGDWIYNNPKGIRTYLYSTSMTTNPMTYGTTNTLNEVHAIGGLWANVLYEVMWNLIGAHGITSTRKPVFSGKIPTDGRFLTMKLVIDAMALQPCNPTMVQARDAIIDADTALTGGANKCLLWTAFAKRGLGSLAKRNTGTARTESFVIPAGVC